MSTLTTLQGLLRERLGNPTTTDVPDATLTKRLNEAYEIMWERYRFNTNRTVSTSIATVSGTSGYSLPATCDILRQVRDATNHLPLGKISEASWDTITQARGTESSPITGKPTGYFRQNATLYLDPVPDGIYTISIRYRVSYTALSSGSDTPSLPSSWHFGIMLYAKYLHWETIGDMTKASAALSVYNAWLEDKPVEYDEEIRAADNIGMQPSTLEPALTRLDFDHSNG